MSDVTTETCFGCGAELEPLPGNYYCSECVAEQATAYRAEREAFDAYHEYADRIAKGGSMSQTDKPRFVTVREAYLDAFVAAYIECELWSGLDTSRTIDGGEENPPLDENYGREDIAPETLQEMREDCEAFIAEAGALLDEWSPGQAGHDFSLTRNGHGAGFWDRGMEHGDELTALCKPYGETYYYPRPNGMLHSN